MRTLWGLGIRDNMSFKTGKNKLCETEAEKQGKEKTKERNAANRRHLADL